MDRRIEISGIVTALAEYYDKMLSDAQHAMYVEDLVDVEPQALLDAVIRYRNDPKNDRFPLPARLKAMVNPELDPEAEAIEASGRIVEAVSKVGPYQPERAREFIGELGWLVVQREGGWRSVCEVLTDQNIGILKAQWRQMAKTQIVRAKAGQSGAPELPGTGPGKALPFEVQKLLPEMPL